MQRNKKQDNGWYIDYISSAFIEASLSESTQSRGQNTNKQKKIRLSEPYYTGQALSILTDDTQKMHSFILLNLRLLILYISRAMRKCVLCHMQTTKAQISLHIRIV